MVGLRTGNVARAAYLFSTASRKGGDQALAAPEIARFAWWNIHGLLAPAQQVAQLRRTFISMICS
jgi:hypothetical protein